MMQLNELRDKIGRLRKDPPFVILQSLLRKVPSQPVGVGWFYLLQFKGVPSQEHYQNRGPGEIRKATLEDIEGMVRCENKRREIFVKRFTAGDYCTVAIIKERIVGYEWFCDKLCHLEERYFYKINIPTDAVYAYNAYILPEYRISGIWLKFQQYLAGLMQQLGKNRIITMIDYENRVSMNTHLRFGFKPFRSVHVIRLFGKNIFIERPL